MVRISIAYSLGEGVPRDEVEAVKWFRKAAEQGNAAGQFSLAESHLYGRGVEIDRREVVRWLNESADRGDSQAQWVLGSLLAMGGQDVQRDRVRAHFWMSLALARMAGDVDNIVAESAPQMIGTVEGGMTAEEIVEAKRLVQEWSPTVEE